jgi:hypothetical protein
MDSTDFNEISWVSWMTSVDDEPTRESWLLSAIDRMARSPFPAFKPPKWRVTCGCRFRSSRAERQARKEPQVSHGSPPPANAVSVCLGAFNTIQPAKPLARFGGLAAKS